MISRLQTYILQRFQISRMDQKLKLECERGREGEREGGVERKKKEEKFQRDFEIFSFLISSKQNFKNFEAWIRRNRGRKGEMGERKGEGGERKRNEREGCKRENGSE